MIFQADEFVCVFLVLACDRKVTVRVEASLKTEKMETDESQDEVNSTVEDVEEDLDPELPKRKKKPGIVYLSSIPPGMNPQLIRDYLGAHGDVGRMYLEPLDKFRNPKKRKHKYTEGWVEFESKRVAKMVAVHLNNTKVGGKRKSRWYETLWNIKYLPRFKWTHLNERLAYERAVHQQRMRTEIAQVKRETNFFIESVDQSKKLKKRMDKLEGWSISQRDPEEEILKKKQTNKNTDRSEFLKNLFKSDSTT